jgi:hypothetical protein
MAVLKSQFIEAGCAVTFLDELSFEIVHPQYPVMTHVRPTPHYLQLATVLHVQGQGFLPNLTSKLHRFLSRANLRSSLVKFTDGTQDFGRREEGWNVLGTAKLITGREGLRYESCSLANLITVWCQDISRCIAGEKRFLIHAMLLPPGEDSIRLSKTDHCV